MAILSACLLTAFVYAFNIYSVISHTVALEHVKSQVTAVTSSVSSLDAKYLELSSALTPDTLSDYGLSQGKVSAYIQRVPSTASAASAGALAVGGHEL